MGYPKQRPPAWRQIGCILLVAGMMVSCVSHEDSKHAETVVADGPYAERLAQLRAKIEAVRAALSTAEGHPKQAGEIDLRIAGYFADYIQWELDHPEITTEALAANDRYKNQHALSPSERSERYRQHLDRQLADSMTILDHALDRLTQNKDSPAANKPIRWRDMVFSDGNFRVDGKVVYPGGFNMLGRRMVDRDRYPQWTDEDENATRGFLAEMRDMGVGVIGMGISIPALYAGEGKINQQAIDQLIGQIAEYEKLGIKVDILLHWGGNKELLEAAWPGITEHDANGVSIDIDHPGTRQLVNIVMATLIPQLRGNPAVLSWDLANEPFFDMNGWTRHTLLDYHCWLGARHASTDTLNKRWGSDYAGIDRASRPADRPRDQISSGEWHDQVTFHHARVARFFDMVANAIRKHDPDAVIHIKGQDNNSLGPMPWAVTDGMDREMQTQAIDLHGVDTRPLPITEPRMAALARSADLDPLLDYDGSIYSFHWLGQSFLYDYLTSLGDGKPVVDFEYHAFSINPIRVPDIGQGHARATLWLAHLHGMVGNMVWYWNRRYGPNPFPMTVFESWFYASISTQPIVAAEYFHTMGELNRLAKEVDALADADDIPIRLLVSKPSYIQNQKHINALHRAYEGVCFLGHRVGFVTEQMLADQGVPRGCQFIILPDAQYVSDQALDALRSAKQSGIQLIQFGSQQITHDAYGFKYDPTTTAFLNDIQAVGRGKAKPVACMMRHFIGKNLDPPAIQIKSTKGGPAFGVIRRAAQLEGRRVLLLVNVSDKPIKLTATDPAGRPINGKDLIHHETVDGKAFTLPIKGVRLIEVADTP